MKLADQLLKKFTNKTDESLRAVEGSTNKFERIAARIDAKNTKTQSEMYKKSLQILLGIVSKGSRGKVQLKEWENAVRVQVLTFENFKDEGEWEGNNTKKEFGQEAGHQKGTITSVDSSGDPDFGEVGLELDIDYDDKGKKIKGAPSFRAADTNVKGLKVGDKVIVDYDRTPVTVIKKL